MFLFDSERTGRIPSPTVFTKKPQQEWKFFFKQDPIRCAESTPVFDCDGNLYFGSHNGSIYSLDTNGKIRWQFITELKVYSSPLILNNKLFIAVNMSTLLCLSLEGELIWKYEGYRNFAKQSKFKRLLINAKNYFCYDYEFKKFMKINSWISPNSFEENKVVFVSYGEGVVVLNADTGAVIWKNSLGTPSYHLAGVAVTRKNDQSYIAAIGQNSGLHLFDQDGKLIWKTKAFSKSNAWANPSIDKEEACIYHTESYYNKKSILYKTSLEGKLIWKKEFSCGCRATVGITNSNWVAFLGLEGVVYGLEKQTGNQLFATKIASADRGLWTSPAIQADHSLLINTKKSVQDGSLVCIEPNGRIRWEIEYAKALSVPTIDSKGNLYSATWAGDFYKYKN
jgi:outer membrane protein assembly factor BamB